MTLPDVGCVLCQEPVRPKRPWTRQSILVAGISGGIVVGVYSLTIPFVAPAFRRVCLPYVPATTSQVHNVIRALNGRKGNVLDIGSGDGRIVIEASKNGFESVGVELNWWLVLYSRYKAWREGQTASTKFIKQDLWKTDMSKYENIVVFGVDSLMPDLEQKFDKEVTDSCRIVASRFPLPNWQPIKVIGEGLDTTDMSKYENIVVFGVDSLMPDLEQKFDKEVTDSCRIVASRFPLPNWQPIKVIGEGLDTVWIYMHPRNATYNQLKLSMSFKQSSSEVVTNKDIKKDEFSKRTILFFNKNQTLHSL